MRRGLDVIVGTPGRIIDHLENGNLDLSKVRHVVMDEADQMLDMGFAPDVQRILEHIPTLKIRSSGGMGMKKLEATGKEEEVQVLLFSATLPKWVQDVAKKYMDDPETVDLVGEDDQQASTDVEHLMLQCPWHERPKAISDLIQV